ncbi:MAG: arylesterase, partial [Mesorhizobium sp.]
MKTILCYGDSLTWGYDAASLGRHALEDRWPSVLRAELGDDIQVIAEGLNGRTTAFDDNLA